MTETVRRLRKHRLFYGWIIVFACFLITFAGLGLINSMSGALLKPICSSLGLGRGEFALHRTIATLIGALCLPVYSKAMKRLGLRTVLLLCSSAVAILTFTYSYATNIWHFYLIAILNGAFACGPSFMTAGFLINNWFEDKRGFALGVAFAGAGIGSAAFIPIVSALAETGSWRFVYKFVAVAVFAVLIPTVLFLIRERPADMGLLPYRRRNKTISETAAAGPKAESSLREIVRQPIFWLLTVSFFLLAIISGGPNFNAVPYLTDIGYPTTFASLVMSALMLTHMLGNIFLGSFFDRFGMLTGVILLSLCCIVFPLFALNARAPACVWLFALFYGPASAGFIVPAALFTSYYFGGKSFASIFAAINMAAQIGIALSGPSMAVVFDAFGSYYWSWIMLFVLGILLSAGLTVPYLLKRHAEKNYGLSGESVTEPKKEGATS